MKYIRIEQGYIVFSDRMSHKAMADSLGHEVLSAGFVEFDAIINGSIRASCYGESFSLKKTAHPSDTTFLSRQVNS